MRRQLILACVVVFGLALAVLPSIGKDDSDDRNDNSRAFVGLWQAVDTFDGSTQYLSITCSRRDDCDVRLNDTRFSLTCPDEIGIALGRGSIRRGVLSVELTVTCADVVATQFNEFVFDRDSGTLKNLNDDPVPVPNVFHRISR